MKSMGFVSTSIISLLEKLKIPFIWSELFSIVHLCQKSLLQRKLGATGQFTGWTLTSSQQSGSSYSIGLHTYYLRQQETILRRCVCLTRKPHGKGKLEQTDNTLPGQLLQVRKIDHRYGLINIVISYYNWLRIHEDCMAHKKTSLPRKVGANGHFTAWTIASN